MRSLQKAQAFATRHRVVDVLRNGREVGTPARFGLEEVEGVLEELALLQVVAQAADDVACFPLSRSEVPPILHLRDALRRWKE